MKLLPADKLVIWAWDELAKRQTSSADGMEGSWGRVLRYGTTGGVNPMAHSTPQRYPHFGPVHPDALAVEAAVSRLERVWIDWDSMARDLMGDLLLLFRAAIKRKDEWSRSLDQSYNAAALVAGRAHLRKAPDWGDVVPVPRRVMGRGGVRMEGPSRIPRVDWCHGVIKPRGWKSGDPMPPVRYVTGVACVLEWDPSPIAIALDRGEYAAWHHSLCTLADGLSMQDHVAGPPEAPARPWVSSGDEKAVLPAGPMMRPTTSPITPSRSWPAAPSKRRLGSAVPRV